MTYIIGCLFVFAIIIISYLIVITKELNRLKKEQYRKNDDIFAVELKLEKLENEQFVIEKNIRKLMEFEKGEQK